MRKYPGDAEVWTAPWPLRVRGRLGAETVVDSTDALVLFEEGHYPQWYFSPEAVPAGLLQTSASTSECPRKGTASYWDLTVGDRVVPDAVWSYLDPLPGRDDIKGRLSFYFDKLDSWLEEDDEVFDHATDPYHRVDVRRSSRHVRVEIDGVTVAESSRPMVLAETGLPPRHYLPLADIRLDLLRPSDSSSRCPYKGVATYHAFRRADGRVEDVAWSYPFPIPECPRIEGLVAFWDERVDVHVDGVLQGRPTTQWS
ncbi:MAG: DUF427 domain-containing protein [Acidimicrobiia bacterium]